MGTPLRPSSRRASIESASSNGSSAGTTQTSSYLKPSSSAAAASMTAEKLTRPPLSATDWEKWLATYQAGEWHRLQHEELEQKMSGTSIEGNAGIAQGAQGAITPLSSLPMSETAKSEGKQRKLRGTARHVDQFGEIMSSMREYKDEHGTATPATQSEAHSLFLLQAFSTSTAG